MHVVLVDNLLLNTDRDVSRLELDPHLGLLSLAGVVESLPGGRATIFDPKRALAAGTLRLTPRFYRDAAEAILAREPDVVGFTALGCNFICVVRIAQEVRKARPELPILLGGPHATVVHEEVAAAFPCFDVVVRNEAENILPRVLERVHDGDYRGVPGTTFRRDGTVVVNPPAPLIDDLDALPRVDYGHYPIAADALETLAVEAGRGCPFQCTFCSTATFFGRRYRLKSPARLVGELDELHARFGYRDFKLSHDLFTVDRRKVLAFCDAVAGRGYTWRCSARMDCVDPELIERMAASGCTAIYFGVEAGSERMQRIAKKQLDVGLVQPTLDLVARHGIRATVSLITGYPQEEQEDQDATLDLLGRCIDRPEEGIDQQLHMLTPEPGTALLAEFGGRLHYDGFISDFNFQVLDPSDADLMCALPAIFLTHHYYPTVIPRERNVFVVTLFRYLRYLGHPVLGSVLSFYDGRMSALVDALYALHCQHPRQAVDGRLVLDGLTAALGRAHPAVSLVRHRYLTERLWKKPISVWPSLRKYVLAPRAMLLERIHDCARLHAMLRDGASAEDVTAFALADGLRDFIVVADAASGSLRHFALAAEAVPLFRALAEPRSTEELRATLGPEAPDDADLEELVRARILARTRAPRHAPAAAPARMTL